MNCNTVTKAFIVENTTNLVPSDTNTQYWINGTAMYQRTVKYNEYDIFINFKCEEKCYYVLVADLKKRLVLKKCTAVSFIYACEDIFSKSKISAVKELIDANIILMNMNEKKLSINTITGL